MHDQSLIDLLERVWREIDLLFANGAHLPAYWQQAGYKTKVFAAFREAYGIESLHGDAVKELIAARFLPKEAPRRQEKLTILDEVCRAWSEWKYAWDNPR